MSYRRVDYLALARGDVSATGHSQISQPDPDTPCPVCYCGSLWRDQSGAWRCEQCAPPGAEPVRTWRNIGGGTLPPYRPPVVSLRADMREPLRRVACAFEWTDADRRDFIAWARRSAEGLADARVFLEAETAKLPASGASRGTALVSQPGAAASGLNAPQKQFRERGSTVYSQC